MRTRSRVLDLAISPPWFASRASRFGWVDGITAGILVVIAGAAVLHSRRYAGVTIDDAFITFRHSLNLLRGYGLTCNVGERIEGTSSPLFAMIMVIPIAVGLDPHRAAAFLGSLAFAGCTLAAYLSVRTCIRDPSARLLGIGASALVAASPTLAFHSQTGMETLCYCCLLALAFWLHLRSVLDRRRSRAWPLAMAAAALMRPEGLAYVLMFWGAGLLARGWKPVSWSLAKGELAVIAAVYLPWLLFRYAYFGHWVPNPVVAKSGIISQYASMPWREGLAALSRGPGTDLLVGYVKEHLVATLLLVGTLMLRRTWYAGLLAVAVALACAALTTWNGGDWMPHGRLSTPSVVPLAVATALGLRGFLFHDEQRTPAGHVPSLALACLAFTLVMRTAWTPLSVKHTALVDTAKMREIGKRLAPVTRSDDLVASELAGVLPYYWGAATVDMFGLCDLHIARRGKPEPLGTGRTDPGYVIAKRPTFYAFDIASRAASFFQDPAFAPFRSQYFLLQYPYRYMDSFASGAAPCLWVRKDRPELGRIAAALGVRLVDAGEELRRTGFLR